MATIQKSPEKPTQKRARAPFSQLWIGGMGLIALVFDIVDFGDTRYEETPSRGSYVLLMIITLLIGHYAWKASTNRFRDVIICIFAIAVFAEALLGASGKLNRVSVRDVILDGVWVAVAYTLYRGQREP